MAVDGRVFSPDVLRDAMKAAKSGTAPIQLLVQADSFVSSASIDYHDGERYPVLERVPGTPDYLDDITKPLTTPEKPPTKL
jgi:hypothetical protein